MTESGISIIIPIYNVEEYLEETLNSIAAQTYSDYEVIMIDDGSSDGSADIARGFSESDSRFVYIRKENEGVSAARNSGTEFAKGRYICFLDADDIMPERALESMHTAAEEHGADIVKGKAMHLRSDGLTIVRMSEIVYSDYRYNATLSECPKLVYDSVVWGKLIRKSYWDETGISFPKELSYCEDMPVSLRLYLGTDKIIMLDEVVTLWRVRDGDSKSATQQKNLDMIRQRLISLGMINELLDSHGAKDNVRHEMRIKSLMMDFNIWANKIAEMDEATAKEAMSMIGEYMINENLISEFKKIPIIYAKKYEAIIKGDFSRLRKLRNFQTDVSSCIKVRKIGNLLAGLFPGDIVPPGIANMRSSVNHELLRQRISDVSINGELIISGCAYVRYLPVRTPSDVNMQAYLADEKRNQVRKLQTEQCTTKTPFGIEKSINSNRVAYAGTGYRIKLKSEDFEGLAPGRYRIIIDWESAKIRRSSVIYPFKEETLESVNRENVLGDIVSKIDVRLRNEPVFVIE